MNPIAKIILDNGKEMEFELFLDTPNSTANFVSLAKDKFYDGLTFHRVIPDFVAQGGCPDGTGMGGPGYTIDGEFSSNGFNNPHAHDRGVLSWARSQARNSAGSQFFITTAPTPFLDGDYAVFGKIIKGDDVLDFFNSIGSPSGTPNEIVTIKTIEINDNGNDIPDVKKV